MNTVESLYRRLLHQFCRPHGWLGDLVGRFMALRPSNRERNQWLIDLIDPQPGQHLLEIGFGPGLALREVSARVDNGFVAGIDHSGAMLEQASHRCADAIAAGRVRLALAGTDELDTLGPAFTGPFDTIYSANVAQFWDAPERVFAALRSRLRRGGLLACSIQPSGRGLQDADALELGRRLLEAMERAGLTATRLQVRESTPVAAVCALGYRPE